ncbi:hypothetical protein HYX08_02755 [Candidatus Woesearchaeota archaeon]|nr:hypothetical protein [Candidatus Woesearchaeota archaeon]
MELEQIIAQILDRMIDPQRMERSSEIFVDPQSMGGASELYDRWNISNTHVHHSIAIDYRGDSIYHFDTSIGGQINFNASFIEAEKGIEHLAMLENALAILAKKRHLPVMVTFNVIGQPETEKQLRQRGYAPVEHAQPTTHRLYSKTISP